VPYNGGLLNREYPLFVKHPLANQKIEVFYSEVRDFINKEYLLDIYFL